MAVCLLNTRLVHQSLELTAGNKKTQISPISERNQPSDISVTSLTLLNFSKYLTWEMPWIILLLSNQNLLPKRLKNFLRFLMLHCRVMPRTQMSAGAYLHVVGVVGEGALGELRCGGERWKQQQGAAFSPSEQRVSSLLHSANVESLMSGNGALQPATHSFSLPPLCITARRDWVLQSWDRRALQAIRFLEEKARKPADLLKCAGRFRQLLIVQCSEKELSTKVSEWKTNSKAAELLRYPWSSFTTYLSLKLHL